MHISRDSRKRTEFLHPRWKKNGLTGVKRGESGVGYYLDGAAVSGSGSGGGSGGASSSAGLPAGWVAGQTPEGYTFAIKSRKGAALGSYFLAPNGLGPGAHIARCAMATVPEAAGTDLEAVMLHHVLQTANVCAVDEATPSFRAIVLDNILETNTSAIELYEDTGFEEVGRLPAAFDHPQHGPVDTLMRTENKTKSSCSRPGSSGP